jgi:hypothetical protein
MVKMFVLFRTWKRNMRDKCIKLKHVYVYYYYYYYYYYYVIFIQGIYDMPEKTMLLEHIMLQLCVVTICVTCDIISHDKRFVLLY